MNNKSGCLISLVALLALLNILALYLFIDSNSRLTQALAENSRQLVRLEDQFARVRVVSPGAGADPASAGGLHNPAAIKDFANANLRQPQAVSGGRRTMHVAQFSGNLNYLVQNESSTSTVWGICNDSLAERNMLDIMTFQPKMAEKWEISPDGLTFTVTLRKGMTWHPFTDPVTGKDFPAQEITSDDFLFFWETINNPEVPCEPIRMYYEMIASFEKIDDYNFRVIWREPYSKAEEIVLGLTPLPRHYYRPDPSWTDEEFAGHFRTSQRNQFVVGCGPYRMLEWRKGEYMRFERYEDYYGPKPFIREIFLREIPEPSIALFQFKKGELDSMSLLPEQWVKETPEPDFRVVTPDIATAGEDSAAWDEQKQAGKAPEDYKFEKFQYRSAAMSWFYLGYNLRNPMFADKRTRQALTMLSDRERILQDVYYGLGSILAGPFTPNSPYADPAVKPLPFDPEGARALLKEAGWEDTNKDGILDKTIDGQEVKFRFTVLIAHTSTQARKIAAIMQSDMKKAGIDMQVKPTEWSVFIEQLNEQSFDACILGWTGVLEPDPQQVWHSSQAGLKNSSNHVGFVNKRADELIETGRRTLDKDKRMEIYREFFRILADEQPYTFLVAPTTLSTQQQRFYNARVYPLGMDRDSQWIPYDLQTP